MRVKKIVAGVIAATLVGGAGAVALATSASAADFGPTLPGPIYWFSAPSTGLSDPALVGTQVNGSLQPDSVARPWQTLALGANCPAGTLSIQPYVHIPAPGPAIDWDAVSMAAAVSTQDASGRFYDSDPTQLADRMNKPQIRAYATAQGGTATLPYIVVCQGTAGAPLGNFTTPLTVTVTAATPTTAMTYSIPTAALPKIASTTTLAATPTTVESGSPVALSATVSPAAATGSVEFFAGATSLGLGTIAGGVATLSTSAIPVGAANAITAVYAGNAAYDPSTSAPVNVAVTAVAARDTTTTLAVSPTSGPAYSAVSFATTVTAATGLPNGTVSFYNGAALLGSVPCVGGVVPSFTTNALGAGAASLTAQFVGTAPYNNSTSAAVSATYELQGAVDLQSVDVQIPVGAITITTPYHAEIPATPTTPAIPATTLHLGQALLDTTDSTFSASAPFEDIVITDTRAATTGFTAKVVSGPFTNGVNTFGGQYAGLWNVAAHQVLGNALQAADVAVSQNPAPSVATVLATDGLGVAKTFATYAGGVGGPKNGSVTLNGTFGVDEVPSSVQQGTYTATVTFTAI
ncbi:Ig-like domain-containing protein [Cellulomonas sp. URHE0023]|uniref:Ig-like domain-containing protein n=1 Tax=Cellulomonas sp. URHE0023 TaxID=1380354 RepID=UPI0004826759|nr:Ig-like domain-containing protein [Cellulomonas sp. URHE0023]